MTIMPDVKSEVLASVLICTRNRAAFLEETVQGVARQNFPDGRFEVVVVDNGSTDDTEAVVRGCQSNLTSLELRYFLEREVGLSAARNRAVREARGSILCFLDDDAIPEPGWLEWLVRGFTTSGPRVMSVGGAIVPAYETELPAWFHESLELTFRPTLKSGGLHRVYYPDYPYGANFAIRAEAVRNVGLFDTSLGYKDKNLITCEEAEFLLRLEKKGYGIMVESRAIVRHVIPADRLTRKYLLHRHFGNGRGYALLHRYHSYKERTLGHRVARIAFLGVRGLLLCGLYCFYLLRNNNSMHPKAFLRHCGLAERIGIISLEWQMECRELLARKNVRLAGRGRRSSLDTSASKCKLPPVSKKAV